MNIFQDLVIKGSPAGLSDFVGYLEPPRGSGWSRCQDLEKRLAEELLSKEESYCFQAPQQGNHPAAHLWLAFRQDSPDEVYVPNVVPFGGITSLSHEQYNAIVSEFFHLIAKQAADKAGVSATLGKAQFHLEDFISSEAANLLRKFSRLANRSTGSSHPYDQARWFDFIIVAHSEEASLDSGLLSRWLHEEEGWTEERASELGIEYGTGRALLRRYVNNGFEAVRAA